MRSDGRGNRNVRGHAIALMLGFVACGEPPRDDPLPLPPGPCDDLSAGMDAKVVSIDAHGGHTCALLSPCGVLCWGLNLDGQAGRDDGFLVAAPTWVARTHAFVDAAVGERHTIAVDRDGALWGWGSNEFWELGDETPDTRATPVRVTGVPAPAKQVTAGGFTSCALLSDGSAVCAGAWASEIEAQRNPTRVAGLEDATAVAAGGGHSCAITSDGAVLCWGGNNAGQLGDGMQFMGHDDAQPVLGLPDLGRRLGLAQGVSCVVLVSGEVYCWGNGDDGVLGNGNLETQAIAGKVVDLDDAIDMDIKDHGCAVRQDGTIACWGTNTFLPGGGNSTEIVPTPVSVPGISDVVDIAVGFWFTCALTADQEIYCWGANGDYELGLGEGSPYWVDVPTRVDWRAAMQ